MKRITYTEARSMSAAGPFSFISINGERSTRLAVCLDETITAAICVTAPNPGWGTLSVVATMMPLQGGAK
jgi:hypothetical protein